MGNHLVRSRRPAARASDLLQCPKTSPSLSTLLKIQDLFHHQKQCLLSSSFLQSTLGGVMSVHALGESIFESGWTFKGQRSSYEIPLRRGFRCRKLFTSGSSHANAALMNRLFEWYIVKDTDPRNLGQPKFVLHELTTCQKTGLLIRSAHKWCGTGSTGPQKMWDSMFKCQKCGTACS